MNSAVDALTLNEPVTPERAAGWPTTARHMLVLGYLALAAAVVQLYSMESLAFRRVFLMAVAGFAINLVLPLRFRLRFFVCLSLAGAAVVFGLHDAAWLIGCGLLLIGLCRLPLGMKIRVVVLVTAGALLALLRVGVAPAPWSGAVWPVLGSMFMFRLALFLRGSKGERPEGGLWPGLAYFFMLPNLVFPLFPVIDYQTFRRTYYDRDDIQIYDQGILWVARGIVHLLLYRVVYHSVLNDPVDVVRLGDLVQFMLGTFLLYLRVSGQFHLIVGLLHLFGFRLPETHKLYYLAHSFTELWRRINIYWTDFMMKAVFYPTYFRVKRLGPTRALVVSTIAVFLTTWLLHSYQWFWLRGGFPVTLQDVLFWGTLGGLVIAGAVKESRAVRKSRPRGAKWNFRSGLRAAITFSCFCVLWSLWSSESVSQWLWMLSAAGDVDLKGVALIVLAFGTVMLLGGRDWDAPRPRGARWVALAQDPTARAAAVFAVLIILHQPAVQARTPGVIAAGVHAMHATGLNARDAALRHRGYYEQLEIRAQPGADAPATASVQRGRWDDLAAIGMLRERPDVLTRDLYPSRSTMWNGKRFTTNRWGMRDREYTREKSSGTLRIALLGPSHVMGNGVADDETFEALVEKRLNRELPLGGYDRVEILNFAVDGYSLPQQVAILEDRVLGFGPDVVIATHYHRNRLMTERYLLKLVSNGVERRYGVYDFLSRAGVVDAGHGHIPVPGAIGRRIARFIGIEPRMPEAEASARIRWIADDVLAWAFQRLADVTRSHHAVPVVLALNAVIDDAPPGIPQEASIRRAGLPVIDLLGVFPEPERPALRVAPWDDHPNAAGHRLIADALYPRLVAFLQSRDRRF